MTVSRDERHHGAQASTDDFNRMSGRLSTDGAKHRSADLVFKEEVLSVRTVLNVAQSFLIAARAWSETTFGPVT